MESWTSPNIVIALYAAVVGTTALVWQIIQYIIEKRGKINLDLVDSDHVEEHGGEIINVTEVYDLYITNMGAKNRFINTPRLKFKSAKKSFEIALPADTRRFPLELRPGQKESFSYRQEDLFEIFPELEEKEEIQFFLFDTAKRKYVSNWIKVRG